MKERVNTKAVASVVVFVSVLATILVGVSVLAVGDASAVTETEIHVDTEDDTAEVEVEFELTAPGDDGLHYWAVEVDVPDNIRVVSLEDGLGEIEEHEVKDGTLRFETNTGVARDSETVRMEYVIEGVVVDEFGGSGGLQVVEVSFFGFGTDAGDVRDDTTRARVTADGTLFTSSPVRGFDVELSADEAVYTGSGSTAVRLTVGKDGGVYEDYENYAVFGDDADADLSEADRLYGTVPAAFGFEPSVHKHPVVVLSDTDYDDEVNEWSDGQFRSSGVMLFRGSIFEGKDGSGTDTVLHETAHAYNAEALRWTDVEVGWFDEGTAQYVEFLADRQRGKSKRQLFGERRWVRDDGDTRPLNPRQTPEDLRRYYEEDEEFMRTWSPADGTERRFGYVFSEFAVRRYVADEGAEALHQTYDVLLERDGIHQVTTHDEATTVILNAMGDDVLRPCRSSLVESEEAFEDCIREVNEMDAVVPSYGDFGGATVVFDGGIYADIGDEENRSDEDDDGTGTTDGDETQEESLLDRIAEALRGFFDFLRGLIPLEGGILPGVLAE